ncbi:PIN domain-containing protein [Nostoc sp. 106C]|uniref:PIN domain-containing protein n=1 Tax=Nostoc sp. 106C TaxID=1932667 RepID=UPI0030DAAA13
MSKVYGHCCYKIATNASKITRPYQIVLDTNVLLAGLRSSLGASYKLLTILNDSRWQLNISTTLVFEYEEILKREKDQIGLSDKDINDIIEGIWLTKGYLEEKAKSGSWQKFHRVLNKVPNVEPDEYDKL